jgi:hypothetical protein
VTDIPTCAVNDKCEIAFWHTLVALQRHGLDNPALLENPDYQAAIKRAHDEWAEVFQG